MFLLRETAALTGQRGSRTFSAFPFQVTIPAGGKYVPPENLELQEKIHQHRLERTRNRLAELRRIENRFPWIRLGVLVILLLVIFIAFQRLQLVPAFAVVFLSMLIFAVITRRHQDVIDRVAIMECFQQLLETRCTSFSTPPNR
jgi:hypothetical protein